MKTSVRTTCATLLGLALAVSLSACDSGAEPSSEAAAAAPVLHARAAPREYTPPPPPPPPAKCYDCGTITGIEEMKVKGEASGMGAVAGAVIGAVIGHQIGDGRGQDAATATGAIGGGIAGHQIERRLKGTTYYHVTVAMEEGGTRAVDVEFLNGLSTGSKVKVVGNDLMIAGG